MRAGVGGAHHPATRPGQHKYCITLSKFVHFSVNLYCLGQFGFCICGRKMTVK